MQRTKVSRLCRRVDIEKLKKLLGEAGCYQTIVIRMGDSSTLENLQGKLAMPIIDKWYEGLQEMVAEIVWNGRDEVE